MCLIYCGCFFFYEKKNELCVDRLKIRTVTTTKRQYPTRVVCLRALSPDALCRGEAVLRTQTVYFPHAS